MGVAEKFQNFCSNIRISDTNVSNISYRYKQITKRLNTDFYVSTSETNHSLYVGSYGRDTEIHISDIDMLFILPYDVYVQYDNYKGNGQSALLQAVKNSIQKTYNSYIKADGQVVKVDFTDGINFEIVPCFINTDKSYTYPDSNNGGSWKTTNPKPEIEEIRQANILYNKNLKQLCRMARAWKDKWDVPMGGLLIDTLAYNFIKTWENKDKSFLYYDFMTRDFLKYLKEQNENQSYWLAVGSNQYVWRTGKFEYKALQCYNIAIKAIDYDTNGNEYSANEKWREIYGTKF
ncbi:SMODS domain-containing nucleotidyltransferase [Candidatus Sulfurimonas baltica]|uniref:Nucleotidyltransferase n=1 Tax=Candidatus Sulfurimonas baltica TaxID=2740404 RepID=A0A7S7LWK9_9BACT|nr:nucleotidyltransferase [Candidatus Sulfurimonas baltica]QOY52730.1 nucleotidyltransferase [Candidatus Sulfurimonas baltica]